MLELLLGESATSADDPVPAADNGTDPTRLSRSAGASYGHMNLGGGLSQNTLELFYRSPITDDGKTAARLMVPLVQNDVAGRNTHNLSDIGLSITNVVNLTLLTRRTRPRAERERTCSKPRLHMSISYGSGIRRKLSDLSEVIELRGGRAGG